MPTILCRPLEPSPVSPTVTWATAKAAAGPCLLSPGFRTAGFGTAVYRMEDSSLSAPDLEKASPVKRVSHEGEKTTILWSDGTKTTVSRGQNEKYDAYTAFCAACAKKMFGSTSRTKKICHQMDEAELNLAAEKAREKADLEKEMERQRRERKFIKRRARAILKERHAQALEQQAQELADRIDNERN